MRHAAQSLLTLAATLVNFFGHGSLRRAVRRRYGYRAGNRTLEAVRVVTAALFTGVVSVYAGFFWWGAGVASAAALLIVGDGVRHRRQVEKILAARPVQEP
jgi:hypothetical protein